MRRQAFDPRSLELVRRAPGAIPTFVKGDRVRDRRGGPDLLVVDVEPGRVMVALPRASIAEEIEEADISITNGTALIVDDIDADLSAHV